MTIFHRFHCWDKSKLQQQDKDTKLCKAEIKEIADIYKQFDLLLTRIEKYQN